MDSILLNATIFCFVRVTAEKQLHCSSILPVGLHSAGYNFRLRGSCSSRLRFLPLDVTINEIGYSLLYVFLVWSKFAVLIFLSLVYFVIGNFIVLKYLYFEASHKL